MSIVKFMSFKRELSNFLPVISCITSKKTPLFCLLYCMWSMLHLIVGQLLNLCLLRENFLISFWLYHVISKSKTHSYSVRFTACSRWIATMFGVNKYWFSWCLIFKTRIIQKWDSCISGLFFSPDYCEQWIGCALCFFKCKHELQKDWIVIAFFIF